MAEEAAQAPAETQEQHQSSSGQSQAKTFTQDEVNQLVEQRLNRTKAQFRDYDDLKQKAARLDELEESRKSEAEKLLGAVAKYKSEAQAASEREQKAIERAHSTLVRAAVVSEASRQRAIDPDAVYALLDKSKLTIGDSDQVEGVSEAVEELLAERAYLAGARPSGGFDGGARDLAPATSTRAELNAQIRRSAGFA